MPGPVTFCRMKPSPPNRPAPNFFWKATSSVTDFSAQRNVSFRQISDWPAASATGMIVPGKRGAKATWPFPRALNSVTKNEPPPKLRMRPDKKPPPVCVFMSMESFIQHMQFVWL